MSIPRMRDEIAVGQIFLIETVSFDWNCPQYITPRFTAEEWEALTAKAKS